MDLRTILEKYAKGEISLNYVRNQISIHSLEYVGDNLARLDSSREIRRGVPEVIFGEGKQSRDIIKIVLAALKKERNVLVSRVSAKELYNVCKILRSKNLHIEVGKGSTTILIERDTRPRKEPNGKIGILSAGTSDIGVAEEARLMAKAMGCDAAVYYDVGIAGLHRFLDAMHEMIELDVGAIIVVAGMEGALASVVSSITSVPVIGVPTSVGYGFGSGGIAALSCMLQTCTFGLAVVNIDNGVGAGAFAALIAKRVGGNRISRSGTAILETKEKDLS